MAESVQCRFFLADRYHPIIPTDRRWNDPLPSRPNQTDRPIQTTQLTYGRYFQAVSQFLSQKRFDVLRQAAASCVGHDVRQSDISQIDIYLEKHGQFYHPARVLTKIDTEALNFVVNVAFSRDGRRCLLNDFYNIRRLTDAYPYCFLPQMHACEDVRMVADEAALTVSLGEWLTGYDEFHFTNLADADQPAVVVWDSELGPTRLSEEQARSVFRQAAMILAAYLNVENLEQIQSWHHAAGDFVLKQQGGNIRVRLVTVRRYAPFFEGLSVSVDNVLDLLVVYLIHTSLQLGLDRLDGTGAPVWGGKAVLGAALEGCLDGLQLQVKAGILPGQLLDGLIRHLKAYRFKELGDLCCEIVNRWPSATIGRELILDQLGSLGAEFGNAIQRLERRV